MNEKQIVNIAIDHIFPHPDNPRKNLGDLTEIAESIRKRGIMQNLTVVPIEGKPGDYMTLIGHRRCAGAKLAGVKEVPCIIKEGLSKNEQILIMLEENMQRSDLTVFEQAQSFQMMLDLGETETSIAEKTGFSKTTVRHRLNIAKLDQKELQKKEKDDSFQLTIKDLMELEKIPDIKTRDKILKDASNSRDLVARAQSAAAEAARKSCQKAICALLKKAGIEKAPDGAEHEMYSGKWETVKEYDLEEEPPKTLDLPAKEEKMFWAIWYRRLVVISRKPKEKKKLTKWEREQKERETAKKQIKAVLKECATRHKEFVRNILDGKISPVKNEEDVKEQIWQAMLTLGSGVYGSSVRGFFLSKEEYKCTEEEKQEARERAEKLSMLHQMMVIVHAEIKRANETFEYDGSFSKQRADAIYKAYQAFEPYGWYFEESELAVLTGTSEWYTKSKKEQTK